MKFYEVLHITVLIVYYRYIPDTYLSSFVRRSLDSEFGLFSGRLYCDIRLKMFGSEIYVSRAPEMFDRKPFMLARIHK